MKLFNLKVPFHHYLEQECESLSVHILLNGFPHLEQWTFFTEGDPYWRLYWNKQDGATVKNNDDCYDFGPQSIILIPPFTSFDADLKNPVDHFYLHFVLENPYVVEVPRIHRLAVNEIRIQSLNRIIDIGMNKKLVSQTGQICACNLILDALSELPESMWIAPVQDSRIKKALDLINRHTYPDVVDNLVLAEAVHMSLAGFVRLFSERMGISPMKYSLERRLAKAGILLSHSEKSIDQIAQECSFCDRAHFSKLFKRKFGVGPGYYRNRTLQSRELKK